MRERRVDVRAGGRRRRRFLVSIVAVPVLLAAGTVAVLHTRLVAVKNVQVIGVPPAGDARLLAEAGVASHEPMIDVHPASAVQRLERLPWVGWARVERSWPDTVRVTVTGRLPVAEVPAGASVAGPRVEVDATGRVLDRPTMHRPTLPALLGAGAPGAPGSWLAGTGGPGGQIAARPVPVPNALADAEGVVSGALALAAGIDAAGVQYGVGSARARVTRIEVADGLITAVVTPGPLTVLFGTPTELAAKVSALVSMLETQSLGAGAILDLQVPDRPTLTTGTAEMLGP